MRVVWTAQAGSVQEVSGGQLLAVITAVEVGQPQEGEVIERDGRTEKDEAV